MNGLGQAMAGELAAARLGKGDKMSIDEQAHKTLFDCVERWLFASRAYEGKKGLMAAIVESSQEDYVRAQAEALAYLDWLKKFSQAYLNGGKDGSSIISA
jgi:CRISPR-associated protein Cmr5